MRVLSERHEQVLLKLKKFDYITARQVQKLFDWKPDNMYRILRQLSPYLNVFKDGMTNIYYLNAAGREVTQCQKVRKRLTTVMHYIMRNDLYIYLGQPETWKNEVRFRYTGSGKRDKITIVADAYYTTDRAHIIEIDYTQRMNQNKIKVEKYRRLIEKGAFKGMPELVWVTTTTYRKKALLDLCEGLDTKVYLGSDLR